MSVGSAFSSKVGSETCSVGTVGSEACSVGTDWHQSTNWHTESDLPVAS